METISTELKKDLLPLKKQENTYKMSVPRDVEEKIRYLIRKFPSTEWSGVLFYTHEGTFENNDLIITCRDFYPMDLGTSGWTEFKMSPEVAGYVANNIELFECDMGLVHSHHNLGAFFSGQDIKMLQQEGADTNCFVSLIVDTKGTYKAAVTRKVHSRNRVSTRNLGTSYEFFGEGSVTVEEGEKADTTHTVEQEIIEYFMLDVEVEQVNNPLSYLDERFDVITKNKAAHFSKTSVFNYSSSNYSAEDYVPSLSYSFRNWQAEKEQEKKKEEPIQATLWTEDDFDIKTTTPINSLDIHRSVCKLVACSLTLSTDKFNLQGWIKNHMDKIYRKLFPDTDIEEGKRYGSINQWMDFMVDFILSEHSGVPSAEVLMAIKEELSQYIDDSIYVKYYCNELNSYIEAYMED